MNLILFGFKKCGKTYFGKQIAKKLELAFIDTDTLIEELFAVKHPNQHLSIQEIFMKVGESAFRTLEHEVIQSLQNVQHSVIALGGGTFLQRDHIDFLKKMGRLVYLKLDKEALKARILEEEIPPLFQGDPDSAFERIYESRIPIFEKIPATVCEVTNQSDTHVLQELERIYKNKQQ